MKPQLALLSLVFYCMSLAASAQSHKATKAEVEFQNKVITTLFNSLPKNYKGWGRDLPIGDGDDNKIELDQNITDCNGDGCYEWIETIAVYSGNQTPEAEALRKQMDAVRGEQKMALEWKFQNNFTLSVRLMVNVTSDVVAYRFCPNGGMQTLAPPAGWDSYTFATLSPCEKDSDRELGDYNIFSIGLKPKLVGKHNVFQLNPALKGMHKVQNILLVLEGSKESAQDFVKNMNTAALRSLLN